MIPQKCQVCGPVIMHVTAPMRPKKTPTDRSVGVCLEVSLFGLQVRLLPPGLLEPLLCWFRLVRRAALGGVDTALIFAVAVAGRALLGTGRFQSVARPTLLLAAAGLARQIHAAGGTAIAAAQVHVLIVLAIAQCLQFVLRLVLGDAVLLMPACTRYSLSPWARVRSWSIGLPHFCLILPESCCQLPWIVS